MVTGSFIGKVAFEPTPADIWGKAISGDGRTNAKVLSLAGSRLSEEASGWSRYAEKRAKRMKAEGSSWPDHIGCHTPL